jgi:hypothetical protein
MVVEQRNRAVVINPSERIIPGDLERVSEDDNALLWNAISSAVKALREDYGELAEKAKANGNHMRIVVMGETV